MARTSCDDDPLRSATSKVTKNFKFNGYSLTKSTTPTGDCIKSQPFTVGGHRWRVRVFPNGALPEYEDFVSVFLHLDESLAAAADSVKAKFQFCFVDEVDEKPPVTREAVSSFKSNGSWGYPRFIKRKDLEKSQHLKDDSFSVQCTIVVINELAVETPVIPRRMFVSVPPSDLHRNLGDLLMSEKGADVVFDVGGRTFAAHRCVLAARSPVFSEVLFDTMKESDTTGVIRVDDIDAQVFKVLLYFVYTDSLPAMAQEGGQGEEAGSEEEREEAEEEEDDDDDDNGINLQQLLVAADRYGLERLKLICEDKLCEYIDVDTVATILTLAEQYSCHGLKKACLDFLSVPANLRTVVATDGFKHLSRSYPDVMTELMAIYACHLKSVTIIGPKFLLP